MTSVPAVVRSLEPNWASCTKGVWAGNWIWDPPLAIEGTRSVISASVTAMPQSTAVKPNENSIAGEMTAEPGQHFLAPKIPAPPTPELLMEPAPTPAGNAPFAPFAAFMAGTATVTSFLLPDGSQAVIGSSTIQTGGSPLTTEGATISLGLDGELKVIKNHPRTSSNATPTDIPELRGPGDPFVDAKKSNPQPSMVTEKTVSANVSGHHVIIDSHRERQPSIP